jgi:AcrR family transcriptional regulator
MERPRIKRERIPGLTPASHVGAGSAGQNDEVATRKLRADSQRTRDHLLDVLGSLLEEGRADVTLPELARRSGVATATVYRHFDDVADLRAEFYDRYVHALIHEMAELSDRHDGRDLVARICRAWVAGAARWARAATYIRSAEGYLERLQDGDAFITRLHGEVLAPAIRALIAEGVIPDQDLDYAGLLWVTLFDERVLVDLTEVLGWDADRVADRLEATLVGALSSARS